MVIVWVLCIVWIVKYCAVVEFKILARNFHEFFTSLVPLIWSQIEKKFKDLIINLNNSEALWISVYECSLSPHEKPLLENLHSIKAHGLRIYWHDVTGISWDSRNWFVEESTKWNVSIKNGQLRRQGCQGWQPKSSRIAANKYPEA